MSEKNPSPVDYYLVPGDLYISHEPSLVSTVVGSCVAVSIWDSERIFGGMVHYLYPFTADRRQYTARFGNVALRGLVKMFLDDGSLKKNLRAQLFGGAHSGTADCEKIAGANVRAARTVLRSHHIPILSEDTGGYMGRKILFNTTKNEALVYKVNNLRQEDWYPYGQERR
jgi:chemotaxis protein CheD